jgi:hypothetical protein
MNFKLIKKQIINKRIFYKVVFVTVISIIFIFLNVKFSSAAGGVRIFGSGIIDSNSSTTVDVNNRKLIYSDGITSAINWSNNGVVLINASTTEDTTTALQVKGSSGQDFINLFNDSSNVLTIKADGQIVSTTPVGTKPLDITSTTLVNNLNVDMLDGNSTTTALVWANQGVKYTINGTGLTIPTLTDQSGKVLTNNASALSWGTVLSAEADTLASVTARGGNLQSIFFYIGQLNILDDYNIVLGGVVSGSYGTRLGYTDQKLAFYGETPIIQPVNTVPLDTVLTNLGLMASGGTPSISTSLKVGAGAAGTDYTLTFDSPATDGVMTWMEDEDHLNFNYFQTSGGIIGKVTTVADTYNILVSDETVIGNKGTAFTVTLPTASANVIGQIFTVKNIGAGVITVEGAGSDTINGALNQTMNQWSARLFQCISANTWFMLSTYN